MRVLLLADNCNPEWPSLPIVGYRYAKAIAEHAETLVITQIRNRENVERAGLGRARVMYLDTEAIAASIYKAAIALRGGSQTGWTLQMAMDYPSYVAFELAAWWKMRSALSKHQFDIVHRITPMSPTLPSPLAGLSPVPFVLGPLNGNLPWPPGFTAELRREREWLSYARNAYKLLPFHRSTFSRSAAILAAFDHTMRDVPKRASSKAVNFPEVGIDPERFAFRKRTPGERVTILYAGRLVPYKLPDLVVEAFARSPELRRHRLVVVGDGPERPRLEAIIKEHNLGDSVQLLGQRPQSEVGELMQQAEVFAFPSIRELGAGVVVEAMACGMACVVVDYGGPATLIGPDRGVKVPLGDKEAITKSFVTALEGLVRDPARAIQLGEQAHRHAMDYYSWDAKARKTIELYEWVLGRRTVKPDFWQPVPPR